jgi:ubiquinone/menaquinone biosynthesis C-methylase UbiE
VEIQIKNREEVARTIADWRAAESGFLPNRALLVLDVLLIASLFLNRAVALLVGIVLAADFGWYVWKRRAVLNRYERGEPRLRTAEDFAAISDAFERGGVPEPTMTDWQNVAGLGTHPQWREDLRYQELLASYRSGVVLDVGCGDGRLCWKYQICPPERYIGVDIGRDLLRVLKERTRGVATAVEATADNAPLPENTADFLACTEAFEHLPEPAAALREFARIVRPGGTIVIQSPNAARLRNLNPIHALCCLVGLAFPSVLVREVVHENTFVRAYTYHWDFTRKDFQEYLEGLPLRIRTMKAATYRFNPKGSRVHRLLYRAVRLPMVHWWNGDLTVVIERV